MIGDVVIIASIKCGVLTEDMIYTDEKKTYICMYYEAVRYVSKAIMMCWIA